MYTWGNFTCADRKAMHLEKSHANDAAAISFRGRELPERIRVPEPLYYQQVRKKKRSLHESVPRKGRKGPNRTQKRNEKNTKKVTVRIKKKLRTICLYDQVEVNGKKGWVTGFTGSSCYVCDKWGKYITASPKYKQVSISEVRVLGHNNNWALGPRVMLGKK